MYETRKYTTTNGTRILAGQKWKAFDAAFGTCVVMGVELDTDPDRVMVKFGRPMASVIMGGTGPSLALSAEEYVVNAERVAEQFTRHDSDRYGLAPSVYVSAVNGDGECLVGGVCEICPGSTDECPIVKARTL